MGVWIHAQPPLFFPTVGRWHCFVWTWACPIQHQSSSVVGFFWGGVYFYSSFNSIHCTTIVALVGCFLHVGKTVLFWEGRFSLFGCGFVPIQHGLAPFSNILPCMIGWLSHPIVGTARPQHDWGARCSATKRVCMVCMHLFFFMAGQIPSSYGLFSLQSKESSAANKTLFW